MPACELLTIAVCAWIFQKVAVCPSAVDCTGTMESALLYISIHTSPCSVLYCTMLLPSSCCWLHCCCNRWCLFILDGILTMHMFAGIHCYALGAAVMQSVSQSTSYGPWLAQSYSAAGSAGLVERLHHGNEAYSVRAFLRCTYCPCCSCGRWFLL